MAIKFDPLKLYIYNNFELVKPGQLQSLNKLYLPLTDRANDFIQFLFQQGLSKNDLASFQKAFTGDGGFEAIQDPNFLDLLRRVLGLGFVKIQAPLPSGITTVPLLMQSRLSLFETSVDEGQVVVTLNNDILQKEKNFQLDENGEFPEKGRTALANLYKIFDLVKQQHEVKNLFEDRNFRIDDVENFGISVNTITNNLSKLDISGGDKFFTGGLLNPDKQETSLKYAYAFEKYQVNGTFELLVKDVKLAGANSDSFIDTADNESQFTNIDKLKNIIYDGEKSNDIEAEVSKDGGTGNIGVEKIYNIVNVTIPALQEKNRNVLDYVELDKSQVNDPNKYGTFFKPTQFGEIGSFEQLKRFVTEVAFFNSALFRSQKTPILIPGENYETLTLGLNMSALDPFLNKNSATKKQLQTLKSQLSTEFRNSVEANTLGTSEDSSLIFDPDIGPDFISKYYSNLSTLAVKNYFDLIAGYFNKRQEAVEESVLKLGLNLPTNYNMSEMFQLLYKGDSRFEGKPLGQLFELDQIAKNLFRNARLSGIKVVKSSIPHDPFDTSTSYIDSIIQTYFIDVQQASEEKEITLFDSQIIYGRDYYYTAFGVYEIDGKYYSYAPGILKFKEVEIPGSVKEIIVEGENYDFPQELKQYVNPCCRFLDIEKGDQLYAAQGKTPSGEEAGGSFGDISAELFWDNLNSKYDNVPTLKQFSDELDPIMANAAVIRGVPKRNVLGLTNFSVLPNTKSILGLLTADKIFEIPYLTFYLYRLYTQIKIGDIKSTLDFRRDPFLGQGYEAPNLSGQQTLSPYKSLQSVGISKQLQSDFEKDIEKQSGVQTSLFDVLSKRREEALCLLCRRVGNTEKPKNFPTPAKLIEYILRDLDILNDDQTFLGDLIDCRRYGYAKAGGLDPVVYDGLVEVATRDTKDLTLDKQKVINIPGEGGSGFVPLADSKNSNKCQLTKVVLNTEKLFESYSFGVTEVDSKFVVDVPLNDVKASTIGRVPMPPDITFIPLADVNNKMLIRFQERVQSEDYEQPIDDALNTYNGPVVMSKLKEQSESNEFVLARSQGDLESVLVLRSDSKPSSLYELIVGESTQVTEISWKSQEILDSLTPNKDYWYTFVAKDITGLYSAASEVFRVKVVDDSGYTYADIEPFEFEVVEQKTVSKTFKKLIKIKPSFDETIPQNAEQIGTTKLFSTIKIGNEKGVTNAPPKFKIRVRSKKTKRAFDINLKFTQEVQQIESAKLKKVIEETAELIDTKVEE